MLQHNSYADVYYNFEFRFTPEAKASQPQLAHMPFGWRPRNCIGMRFALVETKFALIHILREYSFVRGPKTMVGVFIEAVYNLALFLCFVGEPRANAWISIYPKGRSTCQDITQKS